MKKKFLGTRIKWNKSWWDHMHINTQNIHNEHFGEKNKQNNTLAKQTNTRFFFVLNHSSIDTHCFYSNGQQLSSLFKRMERKEKKEGCFNSSMFVLC